MDWKVFLATFIAIFGAELADKTQFVGISMASKSGRPFSVWLGSVCAYILVTALSVCLGAFLGRYVRPEILKIAAGFIFIVLGVLVLLGKI